MGVHHGTGLPGKGFRSAIASKDLYWLREAQTPPPDVSAFSKAAAHSAASASDVLEAYR
jgi:hypothetical protein